MAEFIEKVKQGVGQGISIVSVKSREIIDSTKVKGQIGNLKHQVKSDIYELGNIVYTMFNNENIEIDRIKNKCVKIAELEKQRKEKEEELIQIHLNAKKNLGKKR